MKLFSMIAAAGIASAASADLSFTFTFDQLEMGSGIYASAYSGDPTLADFYGEQLLSIDWDFTFESGDEGGALTAVVGSNAFGNGWLTLNGLAGEDDLTVAANESASWSGSWDVASQYNISMVSQTAFPYFMAAGALFASDTGAGFGTLTGSITYNMTPAPGALALLGLAGIGRRRRS